MIRILGSVFLIFFATSQATGQCAIKPIKPIPPIGCKDVTPECVSDGNGKSHWNWICVPDTTPTATSRRMEAERPSAGTQAVRSIHRSASRSQSRDGRHAGT